MTLPKEGDIVMIQPLCNGGCFICEKHAGILGEVTAVTSRMVRIDSGRTKRSDTAVWWQTQRVEVLS